MFLIYILLLKGQLGWYFKKPFRGIVRLFFPKLHIKMG